MISDSTKNYVVHSKTRLAMRTAHKIGWIVGYVETDKGTWIFDLKIDIAVKSDAKYRKLITYEIVKNEGILE